MKNSEYKLGMKVQMKKKHPCGSDLWEIKRIGMDIGISCLGCDRYILLPKNKFIKQVRKIVDE